MLLRVDSVRARTDPKGDARLAVTAGPHRLFLTRIGYAPDSLDVDAMITRFKERAKAVKDRPLPPIAGEERNRFIEQAQLDFQDFAIIGDAEATLDDGVLVLRVDLRG